MNLILPIYSVFLLTLLQIIFYSKKRINSPETNIYKYLMIISSLNIIFNIFGIYMGYNNGSIEALYFVNHLDLPLYFWWASLLCVYLTSVYLENKKKYLKVRNFVIILNVLFTIMTIFLPFDVIISETEGYAMGICVNFVYGISAIYIVLSIIMSLLLFKKKTRKKTIPVFVLLGMGIVAAITQKISPNLIIIPSMIVFIEFIMFFTIENPDLKMMEIYNKNKELVDSSIEDKTNLLFKISEDVKSPIRSIRKLSNDITRSDDLENIHKASRDIGLLSDGVITMVNDVLNISNLDRSKIKMVDSTYDIYNLFNQVVYIINSKKKENISFKYSISSIIPEKLYGDSSKLKQIICSILFSAINNMENGIIDLDISSIVRYDLCRLIITIRDNGMGLSIIDTNKIFEESQDVSIDEYKRIDELDLDLKLVKKIIDVLGGTFLIRSEEGKGTIFTVILNQLIAGEENGYYHKGLSNKKRILIVDDDYKELDLLASEFKKNNYEVVTTMYGKDLIDRLKNKEDYDFILIDDEMEDYNAVKTIEELKKNNLDNVKIIIMLEKEKEFIKQHYLKDYAFIDYFLKSKMKDEIARIKEKF